MNWDLYLWIAGWIGIIFGLPYLWDARKLGKILCPLFYCAAFTAVPLVIYVGATVI